MLENRQRIVMGGWVVAVCSALACMVIAADPPAGPPGAPKVPARDARRKNPIPADDGSRATGKHIFAGNCQPCHGAKGQGNGPVADKLPTPPANLTDSRYAKETDGTLFWRISNGHTPMPQFDSTLPAESRWNVVNYLRTLIVIPATNPSTESTK